MRPEWDGTPDAIRYVQVPAYSSQLSSPLLQPGLIPLPSPFSKGIELRDEDLIYIRLNPRTHTPFGLGRLEVAFETINAFLGAHRYSSRLASNSVVKFALWIQQMPPAQHERLIRWWQDEIEGPGRVPLLSVESKPEVLRFGAGNDSDLRLHWEEFLLRIIANAFDLPPFFLGWSTTSIATPPPNWASRHFAPPSFPRRDSLPSTSRATPSPKNSAGTIWNSFSPTWTRVTRWKKPRSTKSC